VRRAAEDSDFIPVVLYSLFYSSARIHHIDVPGLSALVEIETTCKRHRHPGRKILRVTASESLRGIGH